MSWPTIVVWLLLFIIVFIDNKKTKHMLLKLWGLPCTPAVVHTSYFECLIKAAARKVKVSNMFAMLIEWGKIQKKLLRITIPLRKWIRGHPVKNAWISSLTLTLIFWWISLVILRIHIKVYQHFSFNFGDIWKKIISIVSDLKHFLPHWKPVLSRVLVWGKLHTVTYFTYYASLTFFLRSLLNDQTE